MKSTSSDIQTSKSWEDTSIQEIIGETISNTEYEIQVEQLEATISSISQENTEQVIHKVSSDTKTSKCSIISKVDSKISREIKVEKKQGYLDKVGTSEEDILSKEVYINGFLYKQSTEVPELISIKENFIQKEITKKKTEIKNLSINHSYDCSCPKCLLLSITKSPPPITKFLYLKDEKQIYQVNKSASSYTCPNERRSKIPVSTNPMLYRGLTCTCSRCRCHPLTDPDRFISSCDPENDRIIKAVFEREKEKIIAAGGFRPISSTEEERTIPKSLKDLCICKPCKCENTCAGKIPGCTCTDDTICDTCTLDHMKKELEDLVSQVQKLRKKIPGSFSRLNQENH